MAEFLIWSNQHGMWWRAGKRGYTPYIEEAGRYPQVLAEKIVSAATLDGALTHLRTDHVTGRSYQGVDEVMVQVPDGMPWV